MVKKNCNVKLYKVLAESRLTSAEKKWIADNIHNIKTIEDYFAKHKVIFDHNIDKVLAHDLFRYLRDSPITKARRAAPGNFPKVFYQKGKSFFTQIAAISEPKLAIAYQALQDVMYGVSPEQIKKYGLMACEYARYLHPVMEATEIEVWYEIIGSRRLEGIFELSTPQQKMHADDYKLKFRDKREHFITQSKIEHQGYRFEARSLNIGYY